LQKTVPISENSNYMRLKITRLLQYDFTAELSW